MQNNQPNPLDKTFRELLEKHTPNWDVEELWDDIEQELPQKRKKSLPIFLFLFTGIIVFTGIKFTSWNLHKERPTKNYVLAGFPIEITSKDSNHASSSGNPKSHIASQLHQNKGKTARTTIQSDSTSDIDQFIHQTITTKIKRKPNKILTLKEQLSTLSISTNDFFEKNTIDLKLTNSFTRLPQKPVIDIKPLPILNYLPIEKNNTNRITSELSIRSNEKYSFFSLELYTGISNPWRNLKVVDPEQNLNLAKRKNLESPLESIEMGILIGWHFHPKWMVQIGIERQQLTERLSWENVLKENFLLQSDSATYYLTDDNDRVYQPGEIVVTQTTNRQLTHYNQYTLYNLPILLGYQQRKGKIGIQGSIGGIFNYKHQFHGRFLNQNDEILSDQFAKEANFYRNNLSWAMQAGLGISYSLYDKGQLALDLTHRQWFQSFTRIENAGYQQKYNFTGLSLAYRIIL